jgi:hypothetical protein
MQRFTRRAYDTTTIPSKPIPTGYKVWVVAQLGFFLQWTFHSKGKKGPVGVLTPTALGGKAGKGGNRTQAIVPHLLLKLPKHPFQKYIVILDNLFTSNKLIGYLRELGFGVISTARQDSGVV